MSKILTFYRNSTKSRNFFAKFFKNTTNKVSLYGHFQRNITRLIFEIIQKFYAKEWTRSIEKDLKKLDDDNQLKILLQNFQDFRNKLCKAKTLATQEPMVNNEMEIE